MNRALARRSASAGVGVGTPPVTSSPPMPESTTRFPCEVMHAANSVVAILGRPSDAGVAAKRLLGKLEFERLVRAEVDVATGSARFSSTLVK